MVGSEAVEHSSHSQAAAISHYIGSGHNLGSFPGLRTPEFPKSLSGELYRATLSLHIYGPVTMNTKHTILFGDALQKLKTIPSESVDLVFADPPYNLSKKRGLGWKFSNHITLQESWDQFSEEQFFTFNQTWITEALRVLKPGGNLWVCGSFHNIYQLGWLLQQCADVKILNSVVWFKPNAQPNITCRMFTESTEHLIWATKTGKSWTFNYQWTKAHITDPLNPQGKQTRNVWSIPVTPKSEKWAGPHPTQKPEELIRRILLACTKPGDTVLDPFLGSGTTSVLAQRYHRHSIGIEANKKYFSLIKKRLHLTKKTTSDTVVLDFRT